RRRRGTRVGILVTCAGFQPWKPVFGGFGGMAGALFSRPPFRSPGVRNDSPPCLNGKARYEKRGSAGAEHPADRAFAYASTARRSCTPQHGTDGRVRVKQCATLPGEAMTPPNILMVEDDPPIRTLTARALQEHGYIVRTAGTAPQMWDALRAAPADLLLLDIMLPGTSGIDICREVRRTSDVPIIFLSAKGTETDRIIGLELGADDYLAKPFGVRELV